MGPRVPASQFVLCYFSPNPRSNSTNIGGKSQHPVYTCPSSILLLLTFYTLENSVDESSVVDWGKPHWSPELFVRLRTHQLRIGMRTYMKCGAAFGTEVAVYRWTWSGLVRGCHASIRQFLFDHTAEWLSVEGMAVVTRVDYPYSATFVSSSLTLVVIRRGKLTSPFSSLQSAWNRS